MHKQTRTKLNRSNHPSGNKSHEMQTDWHQESSYCIESEQSKFQDCKTQEKMTIGVDKVLCDVCNTLQHPHRRLWQHHARQGFGIDVSRESYHKSYIFINDFTSGSDRK